MKYYKRVQIICWCIVFVVFICLALWFLLRNEGSRSWNISTGFENLSGPYNEVERYTVNSSQITNINISWASGNITISPYEKGEITIIEYAQRELKENENLKITTKSKTLKIDFCQDRVFNMPSKKLEVFIPSDLAKSLEKVSVSKSSATLGIQDIEAKECEIISSSGDSSLINLRLDKLEVDVSSGSTYLDESVVNKLSINSSSGDVNLSDVEGSGLTIAATSGLVNIRDYVGENISITTSSGNIRLEELTTKQIALNATSGKVVFKGSFHDLDANTSSGDIKITNQLSPNSFNIRTTAGDVTLIMPEFEDFDLTFDTASGDLECDIPMRIVKNSKYKISTSSGDVAIYKK